MHFHACKLPQLYAAQGVVLRKHTGAYPVWTLREPTVVDLAPAERRVLQRDGIEALNRRLRAGGQYPFPSLTISQLSAMSRDTILAAPDRRCLVICAPTQGHYRKLAHIMAQWLGAEGCMPPRVISDLQFQPELLRHTHVMILGGAHESRAAAALADAARFDADAALPGPCGYLIRSLHNPGNCGHNLLCVVCGSARAGAVLRVLKSRTVTSPDGLHLPMPIWITKCDPRAFPGLRLKSQVLAELEKMWPYRNPRASAPRTARQLATRVARGFDSGGRAADRYNIFPLILANTAADIFSRTGDPDYRDLYLHMLRAMLRYFTATPGGASMPSDMEFYLGRCIANWELLAAHLPIADGERLVLENLLLAALEMCAGYKAANWPTPKNALRHNHATFGALTLFFGGRYFYEHYRLPIARQWLREAQICFTGAKVERCFKYKENANQYQWLAPAHKLVYDRATGRRIFTASGCLAQVARNIIITTDNFGYPCDFGDAGAPFSGGSLGAAVLDAAAVRYHDPTLTWAAAYIRAALPKRFARDILPPTAFLPGGRRHVSPDTIPRLPPVSVMPLEEHIRRQLAPEVPRSKAYDKLAMRTDWSRDAQYLLLEGYSYPVGGHSHRDQNSIIRLNHLGRVWLVDNSYGKLERAKGTAAAFRSRQLGPEDHNIVQFVRRDGSFAAYPNLCELEQCEDYDQVAVAQSALHGADWGDWTRTILWVKGKFFMVVDRVQLGRLDLKAVRCQWNMLGQLKLLAPNLAVCAQNARRLFVHFDATPEIQLGAYCNANWRAELVPDIYPYASPPIQKLNQTFNAPAPGSALVFANLFYAVRGQRPLWRLERTAAEAWTVSGAGLRDVRIPQIGMCRRRHGRVPALELKLT